MSAYEDLVERCENACYDTGIPISHNQAVVLSTAVLAEVLRTLSTVTPEMAAGYWGGFDNCKPEAAAKRLATNAWTDMLRASPLTPPNV